MGLVLTALGIEHQIEHDADGWEVIVGAQNAARAAAALDADDRERRPAVAAPAYARSMAGIPVAALLWVFYLVTGPAGGEGPWSRAGSASAERILHGEPWRAVTALTLHADPAHLLANAVACAVFVTALARELGPGLAVGLVLVAGTAGNVLNAVLHGAHHASVGASTAIFGAIGILGGLQFARKRGQRGAWTAIAGSVALLAMLGTDEHTDVLAHLFGLVVGLPLGAVAGRAPVPRAPVQITLAATALLVVCGAWIAALRAG
jgi:membrane associated rhomboid family serine protease